MPAADRRCIRGRHLQVDSAAVYFCASR